MNRRFDHWPQVKHHAGSQPELSHREGLGLCCCPAHTTSPCVWPLQPRSLGTSDSRLNRQAAPAVRSAPGMRVAFGAWILSSPSQGEKNARLPSVTSSGVATGAYRAGGALVPNPNAAAPHARTGEGRGALGQGLGPRPASGNPRGGCTARGQSEPFAMSPRGLRVRAARAAHNSSGMGTGSLK